MPAQLPLRVRHELKVAFYYEYCMPVAKVIKHYSAAYRQLLLISPSVRSQSEVWLSGRSVPHSRSPSPTHHRPSVSFLLLLVVGSTTRVLCR
jgi:hypothetical protein